MTIRVFSWLLILLGIVPVKVGRAETHVPAAPSEALAVVAAMQLASRVTPSNAPLTSQDVRAIGRQAYIWGWPLIYVHNSRIALGKVPAVGRSGGMPVAPINQLCMLTDYIAPSMAVVPCPNQDVVYGFGMFDLKDEPVVLQVPDFGERFWLYQLGDQRTDSFAEVGAMYGTKPGLYLIVGPDWRGEQPEGFAGVFRCPTRFGYCLPRVFLDDTADDRQAVLPIVNQIMAYPLSRCHGAMKTCDWNKVRWFPKVGAGGKDRGRWVVPETFFDVLPEVLQDVPPLPGEEPLYARFQRLLEQAASDPDVKRLLVETAVEAERELLAPLFDFGNVGTRLPHYWTTISNGAAFGVDYLTRAAVAKSNVYVNRNQETKYYYQDFDSDGARLEGGQRYRLTFAPGRLPAAKGFWSLTLYNDQHAFHPNDLERYSIGTKSKQLKFNADGSLTIYIQATEPAEEEQANWLPAPEGKFSLYLRAYWPAPALVAGAWSPPPVVAVVDRPQVVPEVVALAMASYRPPDNRGRDRRFIGRRIAARRSR